MEGRAHPGSRARRDGSLVRGQQDLVGTRAQRRLPVLLRVPIRSAPRACLVVRILVTGSNGLVGSRLCKLLPGRGHAVVGASRGPRRVLGAFEYQSCDLTHEAEVAAVVKSARPEVIINPASMTDVDACEREPEQAYAANVDAA